MKSNRKIRKWRLQSKKSRHSEVKKIYKQVAILTTDLLIAFKKEFKKEKYEIK